MRAITVSSLLGLSASVFFILLMAGCPPSYFDTCQGNECGHPEDEGGLAEEGGREASTDPRPRITGVTIADNPSRMIRQGFGGTPTNRASEVHLTGERLDGVTVVTVGTAPTRLNGLISSKTSTELVFTILVGHGAPIGSHAIEVTSPSGSTAFADAISITAITAAPAGSDSFDIGLDSTGTDAHPVRSLAAATALATAGDTVALKNGIYDIKHGETFARNGNNVPADITIRGESMGGTFLVGPDRSSGTYVDTALSLAGSARIENMGILGFNFAGITTANTGTVTIKAVHIYSVSGAAVAANTEVVLDSMDISETTDAVRSKDAKVTITHSHLHNNATGIYAIGGSLTVTDSEIDHHCCYANDDRESSAGIYTTGPITLADVQIHNNDEVGVREAAGSNGALTVTRGTFAANGEALRLSGAANVKVRDSTFFDDNKILIHVLGGNAGAEIDLGTPGAGAGNNVFRIGNGRDGILDSRPAFSGESKPITVSGNTWYLFGNRLPNGGLSAGCADRDSPSWMPSPPRHWHIENPGTCPSTGNRFFN